MIDEVEKAHPRVLDVLLQARDRRREHVRHGSTLATDTALGFEPLELLSDRHFDDRLEVTARYERLEPLQHRLRHYPLEPVWQTWIGFLSPGIREFS